MKPHRTNEISSIDDGGRWTVCAYRKYSISSVVFIICSVIIQCSTAQVDKIFVRRNHNATLFCNPAKRFESNTTDQNRRVEWFKEDRKFVEVKNGAATLLKVDNRTSFLPLSSSLYFRGAQFDDEGEYTCIVNGVKTPDSVIRLLVQDVPDTPGQPIVMGFTSRSINISWPPSFNNHNSPILQYIIQVKIGENGDWETMKVATMGNETSYQFIGLTPFTIYVFRVFAVNAFGMSSPSKESFPVYSQPEVPHGKPTFIGIGNATSSSVSIQWAPPPMDTIHGPLQGYHIKYHPRDRIHQERVIEILDPNLRRYTLRDLEPYTHYKISLQVFNGRGTGPPEHMAIMTDEGVPSPPSHFKVDKVGATFVKVKWDPPRYPRGIIKGYSIHVKDIQRNTVRDYNLTADQKEYEVVNLKPFSKHEIWGNAYTTKHRGNRTEPQAFLTEVQGPSAPTIVNLTCSLDTLFLRWEKPENFYKSIDGYFVHYRPENSRDFHIMLKNGNDSEVLIQNLTSDILYEVKVQGATKSSSNESNFIPGEFSHPRKVVLQSYASSPYLDAPLGASAIVALICASLALLLAIISLIMWRKYFQAAYYYLDDPPSQTRGGSPQFSETYDESDYSSVLVASWPKHVQDLHADGDIGFSREYESIQAGTDMDLSCSYSQMIENKSKNRYVNIVAYDHSRVVLKPLSNQRKGAVDYINANFIDGYCKGAAYIGTQGPLPSTFDDYWRMIWEQRVCIIVMITNLIERGRQSYSPSELDDSRKCDLYWPKEGCETYGVIQVKILQEVVMATYTLRTFTIRNLKVKKKHGAERTVYQYHYTNWPDHGVPDHPLPVLSFVRKSAAANPPNGGPIIVHCSAGVGRTGTYIVIDAMLRQIKHRQSINVYGFLKHIRQQRNHLVQTEEQYIFIHDALLEAIESGDTEVPSSHLSRYIQTLQTGGEAISNASSDLKERPFHWPLLERQYKLVTSFRAKDFNVVSAVKACNKSKNRLLNLIPLEAHRVHITPQTPGTDGSDYINATFLLGFNQLKEFIITQHPLYDTISDFWQMIWDHNVQTIVILAPVIDEKEFPQFWPDKHEECDYGSFKVKLTEETVTTRDSGGFVTTRDFIMQSTQDDYELICRMVHCPGWPETCGPLSSIFDLIKSVQTWRLEYQNGPIVVMDRYGGTEAATFCCLTTLYKQLNFEDCVDVYMYAKLYHLRRPGIWRCQDDYLFLYRAIESLVSSMNLAENVDCSPYGSQLNMSNCHISNSNGHVLKITLASDQKNESLA
ncbi:putative receptor-type tyrosine-protein phosphatase mosPTP-1 isoform X2 [Brevipalpus obovatus]|uniref:putative receptor-type tyrosine-protein phosphatase mosPTP-1 isoform X2 n=1 Tax=Brevipalpus obovatus TaxID=246614 RepID=UPI003D9E0C99